jgi:N-acetylneuraminic acid mutarotase/fibronectin type 3 domain-containing protein
MWRLLRDFGRLAALVAVLIGCSSGGGGGGGGNALPGGGDALPPAAGSGTTDGTTPQGNGATGTSDAVNGTDSDSAIPAVDLSGTHLVISPSPIALPLGADLPLLAVVVDANGRNLAQASAGATWQSDNPTVASVTPGGLLKALQVGTATVSASVADGDITIQAHAAVTVTASAAVLGLDLNPATVSLRLGEQRQIQVRARDRSGILPQAPCDDSAQVTFDPQLLNATFVKSGTNSALMLEGLAPGLSLLSVRCGSVVSASAWIEVTSRPALPTLAGPPPGQFGVQPSVALRGEDVWLASFETSQQRLVVHHLAEQWQVEFPGDASAEHGHNAQVFFDPLRGGEATVCADDGPGIACWLRSDGAWSKVPVDALQGRVQDTPTPLRAVMSTDGNLYAVYFNSIDNTLRLAREATAARTAWRSEILLTGPVGAFAVALAPDRSPRVVAEYSDGAYYGAPDGAGWHFERLDGQALAGAQIHLAIGMDWRPQVAYLRGASLMYGEKREGTWRISQVRRFDGLTPTALGFTLTADLRARISYVDPGDTSLHVVTQMADAQLGAPNGWRDEIWVPGPGIGAEHALISAEGRSHLAYQDTLAGTAQLYSEPRAVVTGNASAFIPQNSSNALVAQAAVVPPSVVGATPGNSSVTLNWNAISNARSYNIYWSTLPGVSSASEVITGVDSNQYEHAGRNNGTTYYYALSAVGDLGESGLSQEVSATPALPAPSHLQVRGDGSANALSWDAVPGATAYTVYWNDSGNPGANDASIVLTDGETQFLHGGIVADKSYHYAVSAADDYSESALSESVTSLSAPATPTATTPYQDGSIEVSWTPVAGATSYNVYYSSTPGVDKRSAQVASNLSAPFIHTGLANQSTWYYAVAAVSDSGESALSVEISALAAVNNGPLVWRRMSPLASARFLLSAAALQGNLYSVGGYDGVSNLNTLDVYVPSSDRWQTLAPMPTARRELASAALDGKLYALGGWDGNATVTTVEVYDPQDDSWRRTHPMSTARSNFVSAVVNGRLYAIGGWNGVYLKSVEVYDPTIDKWTFLADMPTARNAMAAAVIGNKIYVIGGWVSGRPVNTVEMFDTESGEWSTLAPMPTARNRLAAGTLYGRIYAIGGWTGSDPSNAVEVYDPRSDTWSASVALPSARNGLAIAELNNRLFTLGGWNGSRYVNNVEALGSQ